MGSLGISELLVILAIVLLVFGGKRLPEVGRGLGRAIRYFKAGVRSDDQRHDERP